MMSVAFGAVTLYVAALLIRWHRDDSIAAKHEAAASKVIEANAANYLASAAAALRAGPLTVGQLKTLATTGSGPDRVDAVDNNGTVVISFATSARYTEPGSMSGGLKSACFQGTIQRSERVVPEPAEIPCTQVNPLPNGNTQVSLPPQ
jgi:hypothetical protein